MTLFKKTRLFIFTFAAVLGLVSCSGLITPNIGDENNESRKVSISFNCTTSETSSASRTILPTINLDSYYYTVKGTNSKFTDATLVSDVAGADFASEKIILDAGEWTFTVIAKDKAGEDGKEILSGTATATLSGTEFSVPVVLYAVSGGEGIVSVTLRFPSEKDVAKVTADIYDSSTATDNGKNIQKINKSNPTNRVTFVSNSVPSATPKFVKFFLYDSNNVLVGTYVDSVFAVKDAVSETEITLDEINLFTVTVNLTKNGASWKDSGKTVALCQDAKKYILHPATGSNVNTGSVPYGTYQVKIADSEAEIASAVSKGEVVVNFEGTASADVDFEDTSSVITITKNDIDELQNMPTNEIVKVIYTGDIDYSAINAIKNYLSDSSYQVVLDLSGAETNENEFYISFDWSNGLVGIVLPNSSKVSRVHTNYCNNLECVTIPKNVQTLSISVDNCQNFSKFIVDSENENYIVLDDGKMLIRTGGTLVATLPNASGDVAIPSTVTSIPNGSLGNNYIDSITIPASVTDIGTEALMRCGRFIVDENNPNYSAPADFDNTFLLSKDKKTIIAVSQLAPTTNNEFDLEKIANDNHYAFTTIGDKAFYNTNVSSIILPDTITNIGSTVSESNNHTITVKSTTPPTVGILPFYSCIGIYVPAGSIDDYKNAWSYYESIIHPIHDHNWNSTYEPDNNFPEQHIYKKSCTVCNTDFEERPEFHTWSTTEETKTENGKTIITITQTCVCGKTTTTEYTKTSPTLSADKVANYIYSLASAELCSITVTGALDSSTLYNIGNSIRDKQSTVIIEMLDLSGTMGLTEIEAAFGNCNNIKNIKLPDKVTYIGGYAFSNYTSLESINIPDSVTAIHDDAFYYCTSLESITIPASVTFIDSFAFRNTAITSFSVAQENQYYKASDDGKMLLSKDGTTLISCPAASDVTIPYSVTSISEHAFFGNKNLTSLDIPNNVISIGHETFYGCTSLERITISESVTDISQTAFRNTAITNFSVDSKNQYFKASDDSKMLLSKDGTTLISCPASTEVTIPNSVNYIGSWAFSENNNLTNITIPSSIIFIYADAFNGCHCLSSVTFESPVNWFSSGQAKPLDVSNPSQNANYIRNHYDNNFYKKESIVKTLKASEAGAYISNLAGGSECTLIVTGPIDEDTLSNIGNAVKQNQKARLELDLSATTGLTEIPYNAFNYCSNLIGISLPETVTKIRSQAFYSCQSLKSIDIPSSVTEIGEGAFNECTSLENIDIPSNVTEIGSQAFYNCQSIVSLYIPNSVTYIGWAAFVQCSKLSSVTFEHPNNWFTVNGDSLDLSDPVKNVSKLYTWDNWTRTKSFQLDKSNSKFLGRAYLNYNPWYGDEYLYMSHCGSGASFIANSSIVRVNITNNWGSKVAIYVDGAFEKYAYPDDRGSTITVYDNPSKGEHIVDIVLCDGGCYITSVDIDYDGTITKAPEKSTKIEFIGDSITTGYGIEGVSNESNFVETYAFKTAKKLDADYSAVAAGGKGVIADYLGNKNDDQIPSFYGKVEGNKNSADWDFSSFVPDFVVIHLGSNDQYYTKGDTEREREFINGYKDFLSTIRSHYSDAKIIASIGMMVNEEELWPAIQTAVEEFKTENSDDKVYKFKFVQDIANEGEGADGHPSIATNDKAANELAAYINSL